MAVCKILGSSSQGNAYLFCADSETLIVELGLSWDKIIKGLGYNLEKVAGVCLSHDHGDHSYSVDRAVANGLSVWSCKGVAEAHRGVQVMELGKKYKIGGFAVQPLAVPHSVECYAYLIEHPSFGRLLFATDLSEFPYRLKNINHIFCEANYSDDIILDNLCDSQRNGSLSENHLSIDQCVAVCKRNYSADTQSIVLLHLSDNNSDAVDFAERVKSELGFDNVYVADSGMEIELTKEEF